MLPWEFHGWNGNFKPTVARYMIHVTMVNPPISPFYGVFGHLAFCCCVADMTLVPATYLAEDNAPYPGVLAN